jgi:hypothetical protein
MSKKRVAVTLRKPQASADIETFVASASPAVPPPLAAVVPHASVADGAITLGARSYRELTLYLPSDLVQSLSRFCLEQNLDMNRVIAQALDKHMSPGEPSAQAATWKALLETLLREYRSKLIAFIARRSQSVF